MRYDIKRGETVIVNVRPEGEMTKSIMGENTVSCTFSLPYYVALQRKDYMVVFGEKFSLNEPPFITKEQGKYQYNCTFQTVAYDLAKVIYMMYGDDNTLKEPGFSLTGTLLEFAKLLIRNANRVQTGWKLGMVDASEIKTLTFANEKCLQVLSKIAVEFETEFWILDKTIHITKSGNLSGLTFEYGFNNGLYSVIRQPKDSAELVTRLYVYGSQNNLNEGYRNYSQRLLLPEILGVPYLESNVALYGEVIEDAITFDEIYPRRLGRVSFAPAGNFLQFQDASMDFDLNAYLLPGETVKVNFKDGQLGGFTFEIEKYDHATRTFTIIPLDEDDNIKIPTTLIRAQAGDTYVLTDLFMPDSYVTAAEQELYDAGMEHLLQNSTDREMYTVECDPNYFRRQGIYISIGSFVRIVDVPMNVDANLRVIRLVRDISNDYRYRLELSEKFTIPSIVRQYASSDKLLRYIARELNGPVTAPVSSPLAGLSIGMVVFWPGTADTIPAGWEIFTPAIGRFLLGADTERLNPFIPGTTGGEESVKLTEPQLPRMQITIPVGEMKSDMNESGAKGGGLRDLRDHKWQNYKSNYFGGGKAHNNMPPYVVGYWIQRKA